MKTKIHTLIEALNADAVIDTWTRKRSPMGGDLPGSLVARPLYVLDGDPVSDELLGAFSRLQAEGGLSVPYPSFLVEFDMCGSDGTAHTVAAVNVADGQIDFSWCWEVNGRWCTDLAFVESHGKDWAVYGPIGYRAYDAFRTRADRIIEVVTCLVAAFSVRGVEGERVEAPEKANRDRVSRRKPPIPSFTGVRRLTLPKAAPVKAAHKGGTHASPVPHHRAGSSFMRLGALVTRRATVVNAHKLQPGQTPPAPRVAVSMR